MDSPHMALDSDCFSHATATTRRYLPDCTRLAATIAVDPPTDPAVCTRISGLPVAPIASAMNSSGIIEPSKKSGALPTTTASTSASVDPESARAASMASRTSPFIDTSRRLAVYLVCPVPSTAASCLPMVLAPFHHGDQVLLQLRAAGGVRQHPARVPGEDVAGGEADALQARGEHRVGAQRPAGGGDAGLLAQPDRPGEGQLLMAERGGQLGHLDRAGGAAGGGGRRRAEGRRG